MTDLHLDRSRAESFGNDPDRYDRARPAYPEALVDDLLSSGAHAVLDVGCGTGIVSRLFRARGCEVLGVDVDERMASVARRRGTVVEVSPFESWPVGGRTFDLLVSGQAWHWVDPVAGAEKTSTVLKPGGRFATFWNNGSPPADLREAFEDVYRQHAPGLDGHSVLLGHVDEDRYRRHFDAFVGAGFADVEVREYPWSTTYTTAGWLDVLPTHSDHAALPSDGRQRLLAGIAAVLDGRGGSFEMTYTTRVITGRH